MCHDNTIIRERRRGSRANHTHHGGFCISPRNSVLVSGGYAKTPNVSFYLNQDWTKSRLAFQTGGHNDIDVVRTLVRLRIRSKLAKPCCVCGETEEQIEMHHVRHIRKLSHKRVATGFNRLLRAMNQKQVPVCSDCHRKIHRGEYDGLKLANLVYLPR